jgi:uncharacterized protein YceH (UPF0502 family)
MEWTPSQENKLINLATLKLSVEEIRDDFPNIPEGSIAIKLNNLRKKGKIPSDFKIRMKKWDEKSLIDHAKKGLSVSEIAKLTPNVTEGVIVGRLATLKSEGKLPKGFVIRKIRLDNKSIADHTKYYKDIENRITKRLNAIDIDGHKEHQTEKDIRLIKEGQQKGGVIESIQNGKQISENPNRKDIDTITNRVSNLEQKIIKLELVIDTILDKINK